MLFLAVLLSYCHRPCYMLLLGDCSALYWFPYMPCFWIHILHTTELWPNGGAPSYVSKLPHPLSYFSGQFCLNSITRHTPYFTSLDFITSAIRLHQLFEMLLFQAYVGLCSITPWYFSDMLENLAITCLKVIILGTLLRLFQKRCYINACCSSVMSFISFKGYDGGVKSIRARK